ncbi:MAG: hypothetical protein J1G06_04550 [Oscillospiraceae bacterium]|nr:hypothetical protein [Oscillospiraceae bacterium]
MWIDINEEADRILIALPYPVFFRRPDTWDELPTISYYDMNTSGSFSTDNTEDIYKGLLVVDVWSKTPSKGASVAQEIKEVMNTAGWWCELNRFVDKTDGVCHRTMRFGKEFLN